ncbi:CBO0543 family protein [Desulfotomaculum defluvii]
MSIEPLNKNLYFAQVLESRNKHMSLEYSYWLEHVFLTYQWWLLVGLVIVSWLLLYLFLDRNRSRELIQLGSFVLIISVMLDLIGTELSWWGYPYTIFWIFSWFQPIDIVALPILFIFLFQYFRKWKLFIISVVISSAIFSFVLEPLLTLMDMYRLYSWRYIYSFPIYIVIGIFVKYIGERLWYKN